MWHGAEVRAASALTLTAGVASVAHALADKRVALDAHGKLESGPADPAWTHIPPPRASTRTVFVYWPTNARRPGIVYGWTLDAQTDELVVVVACVHAHASARMWSDTPCAKPLGVCVRSGDSGRHASFPVFAVLSDDGMPCIVPRTGATLALFLYTPPNVLRGESLTLCDTLPAERFTRLEHLVAMDPTRRDDVQMRRPSGLRLAMPFMNVAHFACTNTPMPKRATTSRALAEMMCEHLPDALVSRCTSYSLVCAVLAKRASRWRAWLTYWACWDRLRQDVEQEGRLTAFDAVQASMHTCWSALTVTILDLCIGNAVMHYAELHSVACTDAFRSLLALGGHTSFHSLFHWLARWPFGIKLNDELARFFTDTLGSIAFVFTSAVLTRAEAGASIFARIVTLACRFGGLSLGMAVSVDIFHVLSLHIYAMYSILRAIYVFFLRAASELFDVFRSKKRNPLHGGRLDHAEHTFDQLFVGTILFTLLVFLFPTVLMYYLACALPLFLVHSTSTFLACAAHALIDMPLYTLWMRRWDAARVPGGIVIADGRVCPQPVSLRDACRLLLRDVRPLVLLTRDAWRLLRGTKFHLASTRR